MKKRICSVVLAVLMLIAAVPLSAAAENVVTVGEDFVLQWGSAVDGIIAYTFTPETTDNYLVAMSNNSVSYLYIQTANGQYYDGWHYPTSVCTSLTAGETYTLSFETITYDGVSPDTTVSITVAPPITAFTLCGGQEDVYASVLSRIDLPYDAEPSQELVYEIVYESDNEHVVMVDEYGDIRLVGAGTATLTATANGTFSDSVTVHVSAPVVKNGTFTTPVYINARYQSTTFQVTVPETGEYRFYSESTPDYCDPASTVFDANMKYFASGDDDKQLDFDYTMSMEAGSPYYFVISSYNGITQFQITLEKVVDGDTGVFEADAQAMTVAIGDLFAPLYSFKSSDNQEAVTYTVDNTDVLMVDTDSGLVAALAAGNANVTLTTESGLTDTVAVTVTDPRIMALDTAYTVDMTNGVQGASYAFVPETDGEYVFAAFGEHDTLGILYDSQGNQVAYSDDDSALNFRMTAELTAGEVYVLYATLYYYEPIEYTIMAAEAKAATAVELTMEAYGMMFERGDTVSVLVNDNVYSRVSFGMGNEEEYTVTSSNEAVWNQTDKRALTVGTTVITVTTENGLTDSITLVAIENVLGDVDFNGTVNMRDALAVYASASGGTPLTGLAAANAECTGDAAVTMRDALFVYRIASGRG